MNFFSTKKCFRKDYSRDVKMNFLEETIYN